MQEHFYFSDVNLGVRKECIVLLCLPCATHRVDTYFFKIKMKLQVVFAARSHSGGSSIFLFN